MADIAKGAVFVKSEGLRGDEQLVRGVVAESPVAEERVRQLPAVVNGLATTGFQATNFGSAVRISESFLSQRFAPQPPPEAVEDPDLVVADRPPIELYIGLTANLLGTGARESLVFLAKHSLVDHLVITGGGVEHDVRRAVCPSAYVVAPSASPDDGAAATASWPRFGNVRYDKHNAEFVQVLVDILRELSLEQLNKKAAAAGKVVPNMYDDVCHWAMGPSDVWREVGLRLPQHVTQQAAESSLVYWAARNNIAIYSPSFTDGDAMELLQLHNIALKLDLVGDIHLLNKSAMSAKKTMMMILGGGVAKHHVCNANLMRNGADLSIFINNAQEYDGSDAGARPDEAVSWGKIRLDGESVKVYSEITLVLPLLVAHAFLPAVRQQRLSAEAIAQH